MAHIDPASGQWVADDAGPVPSTPDAGSIGAQANPALPPIEAQPPPPPPSNVVKIDQPFNITAGPEPAPQAPTPVGTTQGVNPTNAPPSAPQVGTAVPPSSVPAAAAPPPVGVAPTKGPNQLITSQKLPTQGELDARGAVAQDNAALQNNAAASGDLKVQQAQRAADQADAMEKLRQEQAARRQAQEDAFERQRVVDAQNIAKAQADGLKDPDAGESWTHRLLRALAIGLGQYSAAMNHTDNMAATIFENDRKENIQRQKDKIAAAKEQGKLTQEQAKEASAALDAKELGQIQAFQAKWQAESARLGIPQARIDADANTLALKKQADEAAAKLANEDRVTVRDLTPKEARQGKGGGAAAGGAISELVQMKQDGADPASIQKRAEQLHVKPKDYLPVIKDVEAGQRAGTNGGVDTKRLAYNADGTPAGLASTPRAVSQVNKDLRTLPRAIEQLKQLREYAANHVITSTTDPRFHNAVLAVAATTSAGSTDANVAHEKGTLTNVLGMPSVDPIDRKIAELENQLAATQNQLEPLPEGYQPPQRSLPDKARAARAVMNGEPVPAAAPAKAVPKVPAAVIEQAKDEVRRNGPHAASARKLLDQQGIDVL